MTAKEPLPYQNFWWAILWNIGFLLATQVPGLIIAIVILGFAMIIDRSLLANALSVDALLQSPVVSFALGATMFVTEFLVIGVSLAVIYFVVGRDWKRQLAVRAPSPAHLVLALTSVPAVIILANVAYAELQKVFPDLLSKTGMGGMEQVVKLFAGWPWPFAVLVVGLGPGIGEELWCRGFLGRGLVGRHGVVLGVLASSLFFGMIHVDPCQGTMAFLVGIYLHFTYLATRSLWVPITIHTLNNSFSVLAPRIPTLESLNVDPTRVPFVVASAALLLGAVIGALYQSRARLVPTAEGEFWQPPYPSVEYPPANSGMHVERPRPSLLALAFTAIALALVVVSAAYALQGK